MSYTRAEIAGFYFEALQLELISKRVPITWADQEILRSATPDREILDLSLAANEPVDSVMSILSHMASEPSPKIHRMIAGLLAQQVKSGSIFEAEAANALVSLHRHDLTAMETLGQEICCIDELFEPIGFGCGMGPGQAAAFVRKFLGPYEDIELPPVAL